MKVHKKIHNISRWRNLSLVGTIQITKTADVRFGPYNPYQREELSSFFSLFEILEKTKRS